MERYYTMCGKYMRQKKPYKISELNCYLCEVLSQRSVSSRFDLRNWLLFVNLNAGFGYVLEIVSVIRIRYTILKQPGFDFLFNKMKLLIYFGSPTENFKRNTVELNLWMQEVKDIELCLHYLKGWELKNGADILYLEEY